MGEAYFKHQSGSGKAPLPLSTLYSTKHVLKLKHCIKHVQDPIIGCTGYLNMTYESVTNSKGF